MKKKRDSVFLLIVPTKVLPSDCIATRPANPRRPRGQPFRGNSGTPQDSRDLRVLASNNSDSSRGSQLCFPIGGLGPRLGDRSWMSREAHVQFWESAEVKSLRATRLLLQPRTRALNDDLRNTFRNWYPGLGPNTEVQTPAA